MSRGHRYHNSIDAVGSEHRGDPLTRVKYPCFDRVVWNVNDLGNFIDRSLVVINEIDDLAMAWRQLLQAFEQDCSLFYPLNHNFRVVRGDFY